MNLPIKKLLKDCLNPEEMAILLTQAEKSLQNWETIWSSFITAPIREEVLNTLSPFHEIKCFSSGGYPNAERHRVCFYREYDFNEKVTPITGLNILGNFFFENATSNQFRKALEDYGVSEGSLGDIWITRDKGAQAICTPQAAEKLNGLKGKVLGVEITCKLLTINELDLPIQRIPKLIKSVESSTRLDAVASAGFGISRAKISTQIEKGFLRLNWITIKQPNKSVQKGDRIHLGTKGSLEVVRIERTKKDRWRVELLRK